MKPGGQLIRKPMPPRKSSLKQCPIKRGDKPLARVTPLKRAAPAKKRQRDTGPSKATKDFVKTERAKDGMCERCGLRRGADVHHRRARKAGGTKRREINFLSNLILLCRQDHDLITNTRGHRTDYEFEGLLIREDLRDPADVPVLLADGWFLLTNLGGRTPTTAPEAAA